MKYKGDSGLLKAAIFLSLYPFVKNATIIII
jgi:hypothetical protein